MRIQEHIPLAPLTTLQVGGAARYLVEAQSEDDVRQAVEEARSRSWPLFVLGGGSNVVVSDEGWPGLVLRMAIRGIGQRREGRKAVFSVGAGEDWDAFVAHSVAQQCAGVECMSGIPGTVGGTPVQNVGAYGQEVQETIMEVRALDLETGRVRDLSHSECRFFYRSSIFNSSESGRWVVLRVTYALFPGGVPHLEYADLKRYFAGRKDTPTLEETRQAVRRIRLSKAMLIVPGDVDCHSAGSFFKNPVIEQAEYEKIAARLPGLPCWAAPGGQVKIPAARLVEEAGFHKGWGRGPVGISSKHALAIVNRGGATAVDILALKEEIQERVGEKFGIRLQPEPDFVGFAPIPFT